MLCSYAQAGSHVTRYGTCFKALVYHVSSASSKTRLPFLVLVSLNQTHNQSKAVRSCILAKKASVLVSSSSQRQTQRHRYVREEKK